MVGEQLGPYRILSEIGRGGMGTVHLAEDESGKRVALKVLHPHLLSAPGAFKRFLREAEIGRHVRHENLVSTLDVDAIESGGVVHHFLVMEYVEGQDLRQLLAARGPPGEMLLRDVARQVATGLGAIHARGVIHRDLKPENIIVTSGGSVRIMDLGLAKLQEASIAITKSGQFTGSLLYSAPEQFQDAPVGVSSDLYALGVLLYELATGENPFTRDTAAAVVRAQTYFVPPPLSRTHGNVSESFAAIVQGLLEKRPEDRIGTAEELLAALDGRGPSLRKSTLPAAARPLEALLSASGAAYRPSDKVFGARGRPTPRLRILILRCLAVLVLLALLAAFFF